MLAVIDALVLFFASVALKFTRPRVQVMLTLVALALLVVCVIRTLSLPQYISGNPIAPPADVTSDG